MSRPVQLTLNVKLFVVSCGGFGDIKVQAQSSAAAKYQIFKRAREAGFFEGPWAFREFLHKGWRARELREHRNVTRDKSKSVPAPGSEAA